MAVFMGNSTSYLQAEAVKNRTTKKSSNAKSRRLSSKTGKKHHTRNPLAYPKSLHTFLVVQCEAFARLPDRQQHYFAGLLYASHFRPQRHIEASGLQVHHWYARLLACRGSHQQAYASLGWWRQEIEADYMKHNAAGYALTDEGQHMLDLWLGNLDDHPDAGLLNTQGKEIKTPSAAVNPRTTTGGRAKPEPAMVVPVEIDGDSLHQLANAVDAWVYGAECPAGFEWALQAWDDIQAARGPNGGRDRAEARALVTRKQASLMVATGRSTRAPGYVIPQTYIEAPSGRLYAETNISLQNCHREVKRAALAGQWEYDFENCHWSLLYQMAQAIGIELPTVAEYLKHKRTWRQEIALAAGISVPEAKECIIALVYGAALRADPRLRIPEVIGLEATKRLRQCDRMRLLYDEVKRARPHIIKAHCKSGGFINAAGKQYRPENRSNNTEAAKLAHVLQGAESAALRACIEVAGPTLTLLQHDGFTSLEHLNKTDLTDAIRKRTGYVLELSEEHL